MKSLATAILLVTALTTLHSINSGAATKDAHLQLWEGRGVTYGPDGTELETSTIRVVNTEVSPILIQSEAISITTDGKTTQISQTLHLNGNHWITESNLGKGGGACYGKDFCESYIVGNSGLAFATSLFKRDSDHQRQVTTVLQNQRAIKILSQSLKRIR